MTDASPTIKALETRYAGCRFRSRLEARWAVFFDHAGIDWEYEPEGFLTSEGPYLPDFRITTPQSDPGLRNAPSLFEVKPPDAPEDPRHRALAEESESAVTVARGLPRCFADQYQHLQLITTWPAGELGTRRAGFIWHSKHGVLVFPFMPWGLRPQHRIDAAYTAARSARFGQ